MSTPVSPDPFHPQRLQRFLVDRIMAVLVAVAVLSFLTWTALGQSFIHRLDDQISRWIGFQSSSEIVVITLDDRSIAQLGGWPISRHHYTRLLQRLAEPAHRPQAVGIDILFLDPRPEDAALAQAMALLPVVLPIHQTPPLQSAPNSQTPRQSDWQRPVPILAQASRQGHIHMLFDSDGVVRGVQPVVDGLPHLALAMVEAAHRQLKRSPAAQNEVRTHMMDPAVGFPSISLADALDPLYALDLLKNKWVLVGSTSNSLGDMHVTQYTDRAGAPTPGVYVLASHLNDVLHEEWIGILDRSGVYAFSVFFLAILVLWTSQWRPAVMLRIHLGIAIAVTGLAVGLLAQSHWWVQTTPFCLALPFGWLYWVSRKLEHTFHFLTRQVQVLPQSTTTEPHAQSSKGPSALKRWLLHWNDPIESVSTELQARTAHMSESLRLLDAIILQLPDALAVFDAQGQLVLANPNMRRYLTWQSLAAPGDTPGLTLAVMRKTLGFEPHQPIVAGSPIQLDTPMGTLHYLCIESSIEDAPVIPLHLLRMHDITQLREQENQRKKTLEFLSHDMRTPVAAIAAVAGRQIAKPTDGPQITHSARDIIQYTERLMAMMDGFIDYSQATLSELKKDLHLVSNLLDDALSQVKDLAEQQHTRFVVEETEFPLAIECDAHLIVRALVNTLVNALHHGHAGGEVWVRTFLTSSDPQAMAVVEIHNQVGDYPRHPLVKGFGLGLEFVRMVMARHGGNMQASWWVPEHSASQQESEGLATLRLSLPNIHLGADC